MAGGQGRQRRPRIRLLFDEQLSPKVAGALRALDFNVECVGRGQQQPRKGATDPEVLEHAVRCNQVIVTSNNNMVVLCCDQRESVIWVDSAFRSLTLAETVLVCFRQIEKWERLLDHADGPVCLQALKTKTNVLPLERAKHLALSRARRRRRRERRAGEPRRDDLQGTLDYGQVGAPRPRVAPRRRQHVPKWRRRPKRRRYVRHRPERRRPSR